MSPSDRPSDVPGATESEGTESYGATEEESAETARAANKFDIRRLIGGLFCLYGLILLVLGIFGSHTIKNKAAGINVDLWTGLGMLVFGVLMIFWVLSRPVMQEPSETSEPQGQQSGRIRRAPAT